MQRGAFEPMDKSLRFSSDKPYILRDEKQLLICCNFLRLSGIATVVSVWYDRKTWHGHEHCPNMVCG